MDDYEECDEDGEDCDGCEVSVGQQVDMFKLTSDEFGLIGMKLWT